MRHRMAVLLLPFVCLAGCGDPGSAVPTPPPPIPDLQVPLSSAGAPSGPWVAEIRVKLSGCTSCADCRTGIRQISQRQSGSDHVEFHDGVDRIVYPDPSPVRVLEVARALAGGGLLKVHVDRVELRVAGEVREREGARVFVASRTGQCWPLAEGKVTVPLGESVVILASLEGWKGDPAAARLKIQRVEPPVTP